jgi:hypothetical protein
MSSEGANDLLSKQYSSWTFLTTLRGHSPQGYVLSFSIISEIICLMAVLSGQEKLAELTTKKSGTVLMIHFESDIGCFVHHLYGLSGV